MALRFLQLHFNRRRTPFEKLLTFSLARSLTHIALHFAMKITKNDKNPFERIRKFGMYRHSMCIQWEPKPVSLSIRRTFFICKTATLNRFQNAFFQTRHFLVVFVVNCNQFNFFPRQYPNFIKAIASTRLNVTAQLIFRYKTEKKGRSHFSRLCFWDSKHTHTHQISRRNQ